MYSPTQENKKTAKLTPELHELLVSISTVRQVTNGTYLYEEASEADKLFYIQSGLVQLQKVTIDGQQLILRFCQKSDFAGELTLFMDNPVYMYSAKAIRDGSVLVIKKDVLEKELEENSALTIEYMKWMSRHLRDIQSKIGDLLLNGKKGALYSALLRLAENFGVKRDKGILIDLVLTNQELASFCGSARESVNRMLRNLRREGVIAMENTGKIVILDVDYLKYGVGGGPCPLHICTTNSNV
ncbi:Crp/Fnr family transcriptional regulator [Bacillus piscicola]|uniref:Crp/Fnr family transcriptional regulator n=1 Tax=Bacillus piscicola TaxID=1632684 RepID=UPI001F08EDAA|nr:Crp/Fnr family transcriptional regulator [Bacillus piscicola]